ncbi:MAG: GAF domain-containing protein, partial [Acidobacteriota bacterium]
MTTLATTSWRRLFTLDHGDRQALIRTELEAWCGAHGVVGAALYSVTTDGFVRLATSGDVEPPSRVEALPLDGWHALELPDGFLLVEAGQTLPEADTGLILLAAAARINVLKREIREHTFQASFRGVELESLYEIGLAIGNTLDLDELGEEVLLRAVSLLDARRGALYLISDDHYRLIRAIGGAAQEEVVVSDAGIALVLDREVSVEMVGEAGEMLGLLLPGATHMLAVPVAVEGTNRGLLIVADKESRYGVGPFPESDRRTLALFANQAAIALENARLHRLALEKERLEREMELAAEIQQQILPKSTPDIAGYEVLGWNRPARQAGGDYFDVFSLAADHWGLVVGDVTGKGLPAAMMVST